MLIEEVRQELTGHIMPFWDKLRDDENGGFYGYVGFDLNVDKKAGKGVILHSRILWFYSKAYEVLGDRHCLDNALHAFEYIKKACVDYDRGGVYWMTTFDGKPADTQKHTYNIAFAIYALSCLYNSSKNEEALSLAYKLYDDIETKALKANGYGEAFDVDWNDADNDELSENGLHADRTMNTILHLIEAYTELYKAQKREDVGERLKYLLSQMENIVYTPDTHALKVFFDNDYNLVGDIHSYGHDIEAQWLMDLACDTLGDKELIDRFAKMDLAISENIYDIAFENGALNNERENDKIDKKRVWWVQAESVVGFINAYQHSGDKKFLSAAKDVWENIKSRVIDPREGSEWFSEVSFEGVPDEKKEIAGPWKCPYHNGRMCMEVITRGVDC
ncbi:MAG: AGE family epimerase/isomerase [Ruminococcus sp.]|nr:AGE family epimerase/isomerase [Ruminococcus sp.]